MEQEPGNVVNLSQYRTTRNDEKPTTPDFLHEKVCGNCGDDIIHIEGTPKCLHCEPSLLDMDK